MGNWAKALGGAAGLVGLVPGGQAFAGVLGAVASAVATPEGVAYLSPYVDATKTAPFGFPSAPAALTLRQVATGPALPSFLHGFSPPPVSADRPLFRLQSGEREPFVELPGKANLAGTLRVHAPALRAHPQYLGGPIRKYTDAEGWVAQLARLRAGILLDADGYDSAWAFYDDPPRSHADVVLGKKAPKRYRDLDDFRPVESSIASAGAGDAPRNLAGVPWAKLAAHVDRNLERARELVRQEEANLWEEIEAQAQLEGHLAAVQEQYKAHVQAALANGTALLPWDAFLTADLIPPAGVVPAGDATGTKRAAARESRAMSPVVPVGLLILAAVLA